MTEPVKCLIVGTVFWPSIGINYKQHRAAVWSTILASRRWDMPIDGFQMVRHTMGTAQKSVDGLTISTYIKDAGNLPWPKTPAPALSSAGADQ
jgi:hypothetical protein